MPEAINQAAIFLPMLVVVALTYVAALIMGVGRAGAIKGGMNVDFYKAYQDGQEPAAAAVKVRHYGNLMELPTLFYAACLAAFALGGVGRWTLVFAWGYAAVRVVQSAVHLSYNSPAHRGIAFLLGVGFSLALWVNVALSAFARL